MFTDIGIDFGTYKTAILSNHKILIDEPTVVALDHETGKILCFGKAAYELIGRTQDKVTVVNPIRRSVVADMDLAVALMQYFFQKAFGKKIVKPRVVISAPGGATSVEQRALRQIVEEAGGRNVRTIESSSAAAIALGMNFNMPHGAMIVDIGAGTTDISVVTMGGIAECRTVPVASSDYDEAIIRYVRKEYNVLIGVRTAERIKKVVGSAVRPELDRIFSAGGVDLVTGMPRALDISANAIYEATADLSDTIGTNIAQVLENTLPDLAADILKDGVHLIGGGACMEGFEQLILKKTGVRGLLASEPLTCVLRGASIAVRHPDLLKNVDYEYRTRQNLISDET